MILVDTGIWSKHFRRSDKRLVSLIKGQKVTTHPWIIGELALGPGMRLDVLDDLTQLPTLEVINDRELFDFLHLHSMRGIGWVDLQLLVSALSARTPIWTDDKRLAAAASRFEIAM